MNDTKNKDRLCGVKRRNVEAAVVVIVLCGALAGAAVAAIRFKGGGGNDSSSDRAREEKCGLVCTDCPPLTTLPPAKPLPLPSLTDDKNIPPWFLSGSLKQEELLSVDAETHALKVTYLPGVVGTLSGASWKANPGGILPAERAVLSYSVLFPLDFPWTKGGKLPGICMADTSEGCATGGRWQAGAGSVRIMWRQEGRAIGYVYWPLQTGGPNGTHLDGFFKHGDEYTRVTEGEGHAGDSLWCIEKSGLRFQAGAWNNLTLAVAMSTPGAADGIISLTLNGDTRTVRDVRWRSENSTVLISSFVFATFFGGDDVSWAISAPTYSLFRNFSFSAPSNFSFLDAA